MCRPSYELLIGFASHLRFDSRRFQSFFFDYQPWFPSLIETTIVKSIESEIIDKTAQSINMTTTTTICYSESFPTARGVLPVTMAEEIKREEQYSNDSSPCDWDCWFQQEDDSHRCIVMTHEDPMLWTLNGRDDPLEQRGMSYNTHWEEAKQTDARARARLELMQALADAPNLDDFEQSIDIPMAVSNSMFPSTQTPDYMDQKFNLGLPRDQPFQGVNSSDLNWLTTTGPTNPDRISPEDLESRIDVDGWVKYLYEDEKDFNVFNSPSAPNYQELYAQPSSSNSTSPFSNHDLGESSSWMQNMDYLGDSMNMHTEEEDEDSKNMFTEDIDVKPVPFLHMNTSSSSSSTSPSPVPFSLPDWLNVASPEEKLQIKKFLELDEDCKPSIKKRGRPKKIRVPEDKSVMNAVERRKAMNREAALRYREKKKQEVDAMKEQEVQLSLINHQLREKENLLEDQIASIKAKLRDAGCTFI